MKSCASYEEFLASKALSAEARGICAADMPQLSSFLFPFQRHCVEFGLLAGSVGMFLDTGLGKTLIELEYLEHARARSNGYGPARRPAGPGAAGALGAGEAVVREAESHS
jgi:hypothetical protein